MAKFGFIELQNAFARGIRFKPNKDSATSLELRSPSTLSSSLVLTLPASLPVSGTEIVTIDNTGQIGRTPSGGGGSVTSVALSAPNDLAVAGSPITAAGTLTLTRNSQAANTFLGSPSGVSGIPTYRTLLPLDIPDLTASKISNFDTQVRTSRLDQFSVPTAPVNVNSQRLIGLSDPLNSQDAATKQFVESLLNGTNNDSTARVGSTANVTITSPGSTIDGVTLVTGNLVLLKDQSTGSQNGLYVWNGSVVAMTRATTADTSAEVRSGMFVFISEGTLNGSNGYRLITADPIVLGTTSLSFIQVSGTGQILAGTGLTKTGNSLDLIGTANRITANADSIDIASNYAGQSSITTLGTIGSGVWNGTTIALANGGTGANTASAARSNLVVPSIFRQSFTNASLTSGILTLTHNLGNQIVQIQVTDEVNKVIYPDEITLTSTTQSTIDLTSFGTLSGTWNVIVIG